MGATPFDIVPDSSIWVSTSAFRAVTKLDSILYTGTVRWVTNDEDTGELRYEVEVEYRGDTYPVPCRLLRRFGGAFNYEDSIMQGYTYITPKGIAAKAGDQVLIAMLGGTGREGVILGGLTHPTRKNLDSTNGPEYKSEFNGIETYINKDGEYKQTFKAQPTNLADLDKERSEPVPAPKYDLEVGSSYVKWDKTGSYTICDNAKENPQKLFIDKKNGTIELISGKVSLKFDKAKEQVDYVCKVYVNTCPDIRLGAVDVTEQAVLGTTYREKENKCNDKLASKLKALGDALKDVYTQLDIAGKDPTLAGLASAAAIGLTMAATAAQTGSDAAKAAGDALNDFEGGKDTYLSKVVKVK